MSPFRLFSNSNKNAKKMNPEAYHRPKRHGIWAPFLTKRTVERYARQRERDIPTVVDDLVKAIRQAIVDDDPIVAGLIDGSISDLSRSVTAEGLPRWFYPNQLHPQGLPLLTKGI